MVISLNYYIEGTVMKAGNGGRIPSYPECL